MQTPRRPRHAAFSDDSHEYAEICQIHSSLPEIISIIIIHFAEDWAIAISPCIAAAQHHGRLAMTPEDIARVRATWALVVPIADTAANLFYRHLFALDPALRRIFRSTDWTAQRRKLVQALSLAVASLDRLDEIAPTLEALGHRHAAYGVRDSHYDTVGKALIATLEKALGDAWTPEAAAAWEEAYSMVAGAMRCGASPGRTVPAAAA
jgi:hemoglobin-like flavoprotein